MHGLIARPLLAAGAVGALGLGLSVMVPAADPPAAFAAADCSSVTLDTVNEDDPPEQNQPLDSLRIDEVHDLLREQGRTLGADSTIAVVDTGIKPVPDKLRIVGGDATSTIVDRELVDYHGTAMAGIIAGQPVGDVTVGIAPDAAVVDSRALDALTPGEDVYPLNSSATTSVLQEIAANGPALGIDIVVMPYPLALDDGLEAAVRELRRQDVIIVAAAGDRPAEEGDPLLDEFPPPAEGEAPTQDPALALAEEDAAEDAWPAGFAWSNVVAVSAVSPTGDTTDHVLKSSRIDVVAPTAGLVSYGLNDAPCVVADTSSTWAAAEVAGVLALLRSAYPRDTAAQTVARLRQSATGGAERGDGNRLTGQGIIQPYEAVTRPLRPERDGSFDEGQTSEPVAPAPVPQAEADVLAGTRRDAVWWGVLGGGALVVALVLRPLLTRRRRSRA